MKENSTLIQSPNKQRTACDSFHGTIEFVGKRWMGIIVYHLLQGPKRYHELLSSIHGISDRLLTERLRDLEEHELVIKNVVEPPSRKVVYELTDRGKDLEEIIRAICKWVEKNGCYADKGNGGER